MINQTLTIGDEEKEALVYISMQGSEYKKAQKKQRLVLIITGVLLAIIGIALVKDFFYALIGVAAAAVGLFAVVPVNRARLRKQVFKAGPGVSGDRTYRIDETGIDIESSMGQGHNLWDAMEYWGEYTHYLWIRRYDRNIIMLDKDRLEEAELDELYRLLEKNCEKQ